MTLTKNFLLTSCRLTRRAVLAAGLVTALGGFTALETLFAPKAELWPRWQAFDANATTRIDHAAWERFLNTYVTPGPDGINRVAYGRVTVADKQALHDYLDRLRLVTIQRFNRDEQRAYWINFYNALTVMVILDHRPVASIVDIDISPGLFARGPWDRKLIEIAGESVSLNDVEHRILRPIWRDPRLHYAVNCASIGCPNLLSTAFTGTNGDELLEAAARAYVNHRRGARIEGGRLTVSKIYAWFADDFGGGDEAVIGHLKRYAEPPLRRALEGRTAIDDYEYDWGLNDASS
ncbi:MAG TPA: DUF547 domain-containing protein [Rhodospirillales bacterium]